MSESSSSSARSPPGPSGIDWSIFRDGEDDTFSWLWRANGGAAGGPLAAQMPPSAALLASSSVGDGQFSAALAEANATPALTAALLDTHLSETGGDAFAAATAGMGMSGARGAAHSIMVTPTALSSKASVASSMYDEDFEDDEHGEYGMSSDDTAAVTTGADVGTANTSATTTTSSTTSKGKGKKRRMKVDDEQKKQLRRVKNLASVREFRKRKMQQMEENEIRLRRLEAENMDLKMRLKIGKDALQSEQREKQEIREQMREMLERGASEQEVAQFVNMYKVTYSDYGPKRREKLQFHLARIRELLLPTQVTKLCLYSVEQGSEMIARDKNVSDDTISATDAGMAPMSLWGILAKELGVSPAQQKQLLERRASIKKIRDDLNHTLGIVKKLEQVTDFKNTALESQITELQQILTPSQATKFIIWVKENPAFMYMLDKLVDSTLRGTDDAAEA